MTVSPYFLKSPSDILNAALAREKESYAFYNQVLRGAKDESLCELLKELKDAEYAHMQKIEEMMTKII